MARKVLELDLAPEDRPVEEVIKEKEMQMKEAARALEFELAAILRDEIRLLGQKLKGDKRRKADAPKKKNPRS